MEGVILLHVLEQVAGNVQNSLRGEGRGGEGRGGEGRGGEERKANKHVHR